jgi:hypothetical protein
MLVAGARDRLTGRTAKRLAKMVELLGRYSNHGHLAAHFGALARVPVSSAPAPPPPQPAHARSRQRRLRAAELDELASAYLAGASVKELAIAFGVTGTQSPPTCSAMV